MTKKGLPLPNRCWEGWTEEEIQALIDLHPDVVQVLIFHQQPEPVWNVQRSQLLRLHIEIGCAFEYRICGIGPSDDPYKIAEWAKEKLRGLPVGKIIPGNEPNHPIEGWVGSDWVGWFRRFGLCWDGAHKLITPALSPNFDMNALPKMLELVEYGVYQYLGMHVYSNYDIIGLGSVAVCVTECNGGLPEKVFSWVDGPLCEEAIWFSSKWIDPDPSYKWDLIGNQEFSDSFKRWKGTQVATFRIGNRDYPSLIEQIPVNPNVSGGMYKKRGFDKIKRFVIHHSAYENLNLMQLAERCATDGRYSRIPYHGGIDPIGNVAVYNPLDALCWHADGGSPIDGVGINNWEGIGWVLLGNFDSHEPTTAQLGKLKEVYGECSFAMGKVLEPVRHSDVQQTNCPGETSRGPGNWFDRLWAKPDNCPNCRILEGQLVIYNSKLERIEAIIRE